MFQLSAELCFFTSSEGEVSFDDVEFEVPEEPQLEVFKRKLEIQKKNS